MFVSLWLVPFGTSLCIASSLVINESIFGRNKSVLLFVFSLYLFIVALKDIYIFFSNNTTLKGNNREIQ